MATRVRRVATPGALVAVLVLAACAPDQEPLPGEREPVLRTPSGLEVVPEVAAAPLNMREPVRNAAWPQVGRRDGNDAGHVALPEDVQEAWVEDVGRDGRGRHVLAAQPIVAADKVFTLDATGVLRARDLATGDRVWRRRLAAESERGWLGSGPMYGGGLAWQDGRLVVATGHGQAVRLNPADGSEIWRTELSAPAYAGPKLADGRAYVRTVDNRIRALSLEDGAEVWQHRGLAEMASVLGGGTPAAVADGLVAAYSSGEMVYLNRPTGQVGWQRTFTDGEVANRRQGLSDLAAPPVAGEQRIYVVAFEGEVAAFDRRSGEQVWRRAVGGSQRPAIVGDFLVLVSRAGELVALDRASGDVRWITELQQFRDPARRAGRITWRGPVLAGGDLILAGTNRRIVRVDPADGTVRDRWRIPHEPATAPIVAQETLLVQTRRGELHAFR